MKPSVKFLRLLDSSARSISGELPTQAGLRVIKIASIRYLRLMIFLELTRPFAWRAPTPAELAQWKQQLHHKGLFCFGSNDVEDWDICVSAEVMELYKQPDAEVLATKHKWKVADLKDQDWRQLEDRMIDAGEDLQAYQDRKMCALQAVCGSADGG
ncbi:hypothetical protein GE09DRAFT_1098748 [Coniochaeta sp. 2T2.1]|nr:hypothetical protein GE09DRAFT_1098748 [Coniochaeta sp. 2T2.1]